MRLAKRKASPARTRGLMLAIVMLLVFTACSSPGLSTTTPAESVAVAPTPAGTARTVAAPDVAEPAPTATAVVAQIPQAVGEVPPATATAATAVDTPEPAATPTSVPSPTPTPVHPLSIEYLRQEEYPGSDLVMEETLAPGANYDRYIASYYSEGLVQYGLLTVPQGQAPEDGWPVILFNHGYVPPSQYRTTERYVAYVDGFARNGYIVFRPDYRGHDRSEGRATSAYGSPDYVIDVLNAVASLKRYPHADPDRIGMWGHSMGGWITLRAMVATPDIKAGVIWAGVVGSYQDLLNNWRRSRPFPTPTPDPENPNRRRWRVDLIEVYGSPEENPAFWEPLSANSFLEDLSGPIELHHAQGDESVPVEFSETLSAQAEEVGMPVNLYVYPGDNHNISGNFGIAMSRSVQFFDRFLAQPLDIASILTPTVFSGVGPVNIRSGPGTDHAVVGQMQPNESLSIIGRNADSSWWQVSTPDGPAWVAASVTTAARFADVAVVESAG